LPVAFALVLIVTEVAVVAKSKLLVDCEASVPFVGVALPSANISTVTSLLFLMLNVYV